MENKNNEVIDLTGSFFLEGQNPNHRVTIDRHSNVNDAWYCSVVELNDTDNSIIIGPVVSTTPNAPPAEPIVIDCEIDGLPEVKISKKATTSKRKSRQRSQHTPNISVRETSPHFRLGDCPICQDPLGTRSMASTKCGHVYCMKCVKKAFKVSKKCPTCRRPLNGANAIHPLFF